jgi:acetylornithine deacetylase
MRDIRENAAMAASPQTPRALELARTLVGIDTVSANSNLALIHCIRDELARLGVTSRLSWNAERT